MKHKQQTKYSIKGIDKEHPIQKKFNKFMHRKCIASASQVDKQTAKEMVIVEAVRSWDKQHIDFIELKAIINNYTQKQHEAEMEDSDKEWRALLFKRTEQHEAKLKEIQNFIDTHSPIMSNKTKQEFDKKMNKT